MADVIQIVTLHRKGGRVAIGTCGEQEAAIGPEGLVEGHDVKDV